MSNENRIMGAGAPQSWVDRVDRFAKLYMDGENVHSVGVGAGNNGPALMVYATDPDVLSLPEEFEEWEVIVQQSERAVPL